MTDQTYHRRGLFTAAGVFAGAAALTATTKTRAHAAPDAESVPAGTPQYTLAELRALSTVPDAAVVLVTDPGIAGVFAHDAEDTTSQDNTGTVVVSASGARFKRVFSGALNVLWFGAKGDGATDDAAAIQLAVDTAQETTLALYFPATTGYYPVSTPIVLDSALRGIRIFGDAVISQGGSRLASHASVPAGQPIRAIFEFNDSDVARYFEFDHLSLICQNKVEYGIYAPRLVSSTFYRVTVGYTNIAGLGFGYGFYNRIDDCMFYEIAGDGILAIDDNINTLNIVKSVFRDNGRSGINLARYGHAIRIEGCSIENNPGCGIMIADQSSTVSITNCYFENNSATGITFDLPDRTIKAEVIVTGSSQSGQITGDAPSGPIDLHDNYVYLRNTSHGDAFLATYGTRIGVNITDLSVRSLGDPLDFTVVRAGTSQTGPGAWNEHLHIERAGVGDDSRAVVNLSLLQIDDLAGGAGHFHTAEIDGSYPVNYSESLTRFRPLQRGLAGSWKRTDQRYLGSEVYRLEGAAETTSWGTILRPSEAPELVGRYVYFACAVKASEESVRAILSSSQLGPCQTAPLGTTDWTVISYTDLVTDASEISFGIQKSADSAGSTLLVARPVLSVVGVPFHRVHAA